MTSELSPWSSEELVVLEIHVQSKARQK